ADRRHGRLMSDNDYGIRAVLDSSAMLSYVRGHVHVGELVIDIAAEGASVALPTVALLGAYTRAGDDESVRDRLGVLTALDGIEVLPLGPDDAATVSSFVPQA